MSAIMTNFSPQPSVLKEPRAFLRVIQFVLAILCFSILCSSRGSIVITQPKCEDVTINYGYPFGLNNANVKFCGQNAGPKNLTVTVHPLAKFTANSGAQFFCFVGVVSFLMTMVLLIIYICFGGLIPQKSQAANIDFIVAAVWTVVWFISWIVWADQIHNLTAKYKAKAILQDLQLKGYCNFGCKELTDPDFSSAIVSVLFGVVNFLVWGASLWFFFKETNWHKEPLTEEPFSNPASAEPADTSSTPYQNP